MKKKIMTMMLAAVVAGKSGGGGGKRANENGKVKEEKGVDGGKVGERGGAGTRPAESLGGRASEDSDDPGSNTTGGLYEQVYGGRMFEAFNDWIFDEARQEGDTTVLENPQDGQQGWHVIYFQSWDDPVWKNTADSSLRGTDYNAWLTEIQDGLEATEGSGINYVG